MRCKNSANKICWLQWCRCIQNFSFTICPFYEILQRISWGHMWHYNLTFIDLKAYSSYYIRFNVTTCLHFVVCVFCHVCLFLNLVIYFFTLNHKYYWVNFSSDWSYYTKADQKSNIAGLKFMDIRKTTRFKYPSILTLDFDLILGYFLLFGALMGYF